MTVAGLTAMALVVLVLLLVAYLRPSDRAPGSDGATETTTSAPDGPRHAAAAANVGPTPPVLPARDLDEALRITGGSLDIAESLLAQMLDELPGQTEMLAAAVARGDWAAAGVVAQGIRGSTAVCAVPALYAAVCRLQSAARTEDTGAIAAALGEIDHERRRLLIPGQLPGRISALAQASAP